MLKSPKALQWTLPPVTEAEIQDQIVEGLRLLGYEVLVTSARSVRKGYGADHGVPDLLVRHPAWPFGLWLGIEVKRPNAKVRWSHKRQRELWEAKMTALAKSLEDAAYAIRQTEIEAFDCPKTLHPTVAQLALDCTAEVFHSGD